MLFSMLLIEPIKTISALLYANYQSVWCSDTHSRRTCTGHLWSIDSCFEGLSAPEGPEVHPEEGQNIPPVAQGTQLPLVTKSLFSLVDKGCGTEWTGVGLHCSHRPGGQAKVFRELSEKYSLPRTHHPPGRGLLQRSVSPYPPVSSARAV